MRFHAGEPGRTTPRKGDRHADLFSADHRRAEDVDMTLAPTALSPAAPAAAPSAAADVTSLLPTREAVIDRIVEHVTAPDGRVTTLLILGLLRRDDGWPTPQSTLQQVTMLLAGSLRGEDWLGSSGPAEFVILIDGPLTAAETAAARLVASVAALDIPGLSASAGIADLTAGLGAGEVLRRATVSLTTARHVGPGTVVSYRAPR
jgi:GGDEF domain-containing protein